ncbi:sulfate ABC transporter substrate-binding protein [Chondromyces apiculatus]|uniref:Sulfate and thiosulfate binding protein CysP n=1 Tax=Chondromyces apiculatus DSM 436 TaxID=1192034 RepID=A0A017T5H8_9BACT|nr:sulfate ABC transporter substrate-binding protein [Chondromyces apiculatus]EYF04030.1 Sulfate and thiosulfate binding protein CysP [Chondromyces apiculatus DSM 436]
MTLPPSSPQTEPTGRPTVPADPQGAPTAAARLVAAVATSLAAILAALSAFAVRVPVALAVLVGCAACTRGRDDPPTDQRLVLAAYSAAREVLEREIIPAFTADHLARTGKRVHIESSYLASGAQARAVIAGFNADVVALALAPDIDRIAAAGLITHDWTARPHGGTFATTLVAFAVRPGNPQHITGWPDLARPGISLLMPNPRTSGGAMWNAAALHSAALRGHAGVSAHDDAAAAGYLRAVLRNVVILDKGARESIITFEKGVGDVAVTYESEIVAGRMAGRQSDTVIPSSTLQIDIPAAIVDAYTDRHGTRDVAEAFLAFLQTTTAQRALVRYGFRSVDPAVAAEPPPAGEPPPLTPPDLFRIEDIGGWPRTQKTLFGEAGLFTRTWEAIYASE